MLLFAAKCVFWSCVALLTHHHVVYPLSIHFLAARRRRSLQSESSGDLDRPIRAADLPSVTLIVPAHNEAQYLESKMRCLAALDYPPERLQMVIALDGCTDGSLDVTMSAGESGVRDADIEVVEFATNIGKLNVLNRTIARATSQLIGLSDASALVPAQALKRAASHFADPTVGFVAASYRLSESATAGEGAHIAALVATRRDEGEMDSPMGAHGALYFFRRDLWEPLEQDTINDDFVLPMRIIAKGFRGVYDDKIDCVELEQTAPGQEWRRRVRIAAGNIQQSLRLGRLADPRRPWLAYMFVSGKGGRPFAPFIALAALAAVMALAFSGEGLYGVLAVVGVAILAVGLVGGRMSSQRALPRVVSWLSFLTEGYLASLYGVVVYLRGRRIERWQREDIAGATGVVRWSSPRARARRETDEPKVGEQPTRDDAANSTQVPRRENKATPVPRRIKLAILRVCKATGLFALGRRLRRRGVLILCYHAAWEARFPYSGGPMFIRPETFNRRMQAVSDKNHPVISLDTAVAALQGKCELPENAIVITIDDGWASTYSTFMPALERFQFPATLYLHTDVPPGGDPVMRVLAWTTRELTHRETLSADAERYFDRALDAHLDGATRLEAYVSFCAACGLDAEDFTSGRNFEYMSDTELKALPLAGIDVQLHTHTHSMHDFSEDKVALEIDENARHIMRRLGVERGHLQHFCYPSGVHQGSAARILGRLGVVSATTCEAGLANGDTNLFELPRLIDGDHIEDIEFEAELEGFSELLRRGRRRLQAMNPARWMSTLSPRDRRGSEAIGAGKPS